MKRFMILALLVVAFLTGADARVKQLLILHTNDTHSCIMPLKETLADTAKAGRGGYIRRVAMINQEREKNPNLLLFVKL